MLGVLFRAVVVGLSLKDADAMKSKLTHSFCCKSKSESRPMAVNASPYVFDIVSKDYLQCSFQHSVHGICLEVSKERVPSVIE